MLIEFGGETLVLLPDRAMFWPAQQALLVADTHFGKAGVFRRAGVPIPEGIDAHDLARLSRLVQHQDATRLIILGDFFHGSPQASGAFIEAFGAWLDRHAHLRVDVVAGNHDRHGAMGWWSTRIHWHAPSLLLAPLLFSHEPLESDQAHVVCGHLHPVMHLSSGSGDHARVPAFWITQRCATLPSFGAFTGGAAIRAQPRDRVFVIAGDEVLALD
jgi:uncharacterized protein